MIEVFGVLSILYLLWCICKYNILSDTELKRREDEAFREGFLCGYRHGQKTMIIDFPEVER